MGINTSSVPTTTSGRQTIDVNRATGDREHRPDMPQLSDMTPHIDRNGILTGIAGTMDQNSFQTLAGVAKRYNNLVTIERDEKTKNLYFDYNLHRITWNPKTHEVTAVPLNIPSEPSKKPNSGNVPIDTQPQKKETPTENKINLSELPEEYKKLRVAMAAGENKDYNFKTRTGVRGIVEKGLEGLAKGINKRVTGWAGESEFDQRILPAISKTYGTQFARTTPQGLEYASAEALSPAEVNQRQSMRAMSDIRLAETLAAIKERASAAKRTMNTKGISEKQKTESSSLYQTLLPFLLQNGYTEDQI